MTSTPDALLVSLAGVAELAGVRRPVASMWRTRFASGDDAFPRSVGRRDGVEAFAVADVADWLVRTGHGKNPDARADAAAWAAPDGFSFADADAVAELEALVALRAAAGETLPTSADELVALATRLDPSDDSLQTEIARHVARGDLWTGFAAALIDAAYSPAAALDVITRRHRATTAGEGSRGPLDDAALELVVATCSALVTRGDGSGRVALGAGIDHRLGASVIDTLGDDVDLAVDESRSSRRLRRRLRAAHVWLEGDADARSAAVRLFRVPVETGEDATASLARIDELTLSLDVDDAAIVIGPARVLIDALPPAADGLRADVLRSGRLRAAVRLPAGLVDTAPREALALWVLGAPVGDLPIADRFTAVADLIDTALTPATCADIVSDVLAGMGSARAVRAHAFRFARLVRTGTLIARGGALIDGLIPRTRPDLRTADLAELLDAAARVASDDLPPDLPTTEVGPRTAAAGEASVAELLDQGHLRVLSGTRIAAGLIGEDGLTVVTGQDLDDPAGIGARRVDQLAFANAHPNAALTRPNDIVFRTSPTAAGWVDREGSKVVAYPARVFRVTEADPGGLVPLLVAADIAGQPAGPGAWRRWRLRRVPPASAPLLDRALESLSAARADLRARAARLDRYARLMMDAVAAGVVTLTDTE